MVVPPLDPAEAASLSGFKGADALDSYLVTGGFPSVVRARMDRSIEDFLTDQLADDGTPFVSTGRLVLDTELGASDQARSILSVLGEGFRKRADLANETGIDAANLKRPLDVLIHEKHVIEARRPISTAASRDTRYEISDPFLRFYMRFIEHHRGEIERGRGRVIAPLILRDWSTYRGKAIEAVIRRALEALIPDVRLGDAAVVGAYWTDDHEVEVDLVGADRRDPPTRSIAFVGTVKWRQRRRISQGDDAALRASAARDPRRGPGQDPDRRGVPGRSGCDSHQGLRCRVRRVRHPRCLGLALTGPPREAAAVAGSRLLSPVSEVLRLRAGQPVSQRLRHGILGR